MTKDSLSLCVALLGGIGRFPFAPGTVATALAGIPVVWIMGLLPLPLSFFLLALVVAAGCYAAEQAERIFGSKDPGAVVIDELAGYMVTMIGFSVTVKSLFLGFLAFRLFDIWKPWPIRELDRNIKGGIGIVVDDLAAGVFAHAAVWVCLKLWS